MRPGDEKDTDKGRVLYGMQALRGSLPCAEYRKHLAAGEAVII